MKIFNAIPEELFIIGVIGLGIVAVSFVFYFDRRKEHKVKKNLLDKFGEYGKVVEVRFQSNSLYASVDVELASGYTITAQQRLDGDFWPVFKDEVVRVEVEDNAFIIPPDTERVTLYCEKLNKLANTAIKSNERQVDY